LAVEYRSQAEREQAHGAVTAEIPQYMPQGTGNQEARPWFQMENIQETLQLAQIMGGTKRFDEKERERNKEGVGQFLRQVLQPGQVISRDVDTNIKCWIAEIDKKLSAQLNEIMHAPEFQRLEATWRGLHYLVHQSETGDLLKIRVLNVSKRDLFKDLEKAVEFDQSALFKKVYEDEFCHLGEPFGLLVGDYEFDHQPKEIHVLRWIANVAAFSHVPFVTAANPRLFNLHSYTELKATQDVTRVFEGDEYVEWNKFRESDDSCYIGLTLPRILARLPYGENFKRVDEFNFEEFVDGKDHKKYLWMSAIWAFAARVTDAYAKYGWFERICGVDGGAEVEGLPVHLFSPDEGSSPVPCSVEMVIADRRQKELGELGFLPLVFCRDKDAIAFLEARSCHKQRADREPPAEREFKLNHLLGAIRFLHYLSLLARDKLDSFMECIDCERWLNEWIKNYVQPSSQSPSPEQRSRYPLAEAHVEVRPNKNKPGRYKLVVWLRLHADSGPTSRQQFIAEVPARI
jgi:type VI secretion system protein ImpC